MLLDRKMKRIDGTEQDLSDFQGQVVLIVNVASYCGNTPQYSGLEALYQKYRERGFVVLGFPANNFGEQEPGTDAEIERFCSTNYGVTFPLFSKVSADGYDIEPLYKELTSQAPPVGGRVTWNFQKFLLDREGRQVQMFRPDLSPQSQVVVSKIEELLGPDPQAG
jgi:glutathione peroxidase